MTGPVDYRDPEIDQAASESECWLEVAHQRIDRALDYEPIIVRCGGGQDALLLVIQKIGRLLGIEIHCPPMPEVDLHITDRLRRMAQVSRFRFREVSLEGNWWLEEGPPLLVWKPGTEEPRAAVWAGSRFVLHNPLKETRTPVNETIAAGLSRRGFMIYPCLPHESTLDGVRRFAMEGAWGDIRRILLVGAAVLLIGLLVPVATGVIVSRAIPDGRASLLVEMMLLIVAAAVGVATATAVRSFLTIRVSTIIDLRLQAAIWDRVLRLPTGFFRRFTTGDLADRILGIDSIRRLLMGPVLGGIIGGLFAGVSFLLMIFYDPSLTTFGIIFSLLTVVVFAWLARKQLRFTQRFFDSRGQVNSLVLEMITGIVKLRLAASEERAFARWAEAFAGQQRADFQGGRVAAVQSVFSTLLPSIGILGMVLVAGVQAGSMDLGAFAVFNSALGQFIIAVSALARALATAQQAVPYIRRLRPVLEADPEVEETGFDPGRLSGRIVVRSVSFRYREATSPVLDNVSFSIDPGQFVAIVGSSGAGKSTLLRLLLGFERPDMGAVFYDDRNLANLDLHRLRSQLGTVLQDARVIPGSLYENIAGSAPMSDEEVMAAAAKAGLAEDIKDLPMGLETFVSEDGRTFSGGQRQRLMIARALIRNPAIIFFDEATSALDNRTQAVVSESLDALQVTRLVIAHRLSTIRNADKILVLDRGRLVESGTFEELMGKGGKFHELAKRQLA